MPCMGWCPRWLAAARSSALEPELDSPISGAGCHHRDDSPEDLVILKFVNHPLPCAPSSVDDHEYGYRVPSKAEGGGFVFSMEQKGTRGVLVVRSIPYTKT